MKKGLLKETFFVLDNLFVEVISDIDYF
ncbi:hypothetical protein SaSA20_1177a [Streptococcus agalactiae]|nr:hypothetical protein SaSA20_1177a [Streptococcus agalactiae]